MTFFSYHPTVCFTISFYNSCLIPQIFAKLMLIRLWTFRIPIYRYRHNRSQNYFALFAYSNPIDVGTDVLLFIGFSGPTPPPPPNVRP